MSESYVPGIPCDVTPERFSAMVHGARDFAVVLVDPDGGIASWNPGAEGMSGFASGHMRGCHVSTWYAEERRSLVLELLSRARRDGRAEDTGWKLRRDGSRFWANSVITAIADAEHHFLGFTEITRDVSASIATGQQDELLRAVVEFAGVSVIATTVDGLITVFNPGAERILGYRAAEMIGRHTPAQFHVPEEVEYRAEELSREFGREILPGFAVFVTKALATGIAEEREWTYIHRSGRRFPVRLSVTAIRSRDGQVRGFLGIATDISQQKQQLEELHQAQVLLQEKYSEAEAYRMALETHAIVSVTDARGLITMVNDAFCAISGYAREELIGKSHAVINSGHHPAAFWRGMWSKVLAGNAWHGVVCNRAKNGQLYWVDSLIAPFRSIDGKLDRIVSIRFDLTPQKILEAQLQSERERLALALAGGEVGTWDWDVASGRLSWDERMYRLYDVDQREFSGAYEAWSRRLHPDDVAAAEAALQAALRGEREFDTVFRIIDRNSAIRHIRARAFVRRAADGAPQQMIGTNWDITRETEQAEALQKASERAQAAARAKADFLATMSHEIRTPMNGVIGLTNLLLKTGLSGEQRDYVETLRSCGESLLVLINDILDVSKFEAGRVELEHIPFSPARLLEDVVLLYQGQAEQKGLALTCRIHTELAHLVVGDPTRLRQVLLNIVSNAIKFTLHGSVTLSMEAQDAGDLCAVTFRICDTGVGMTPAQVAALGEAFTQADASTTRRFGGTGLGMTIVKAILSLMRTSLQVESALEMGTTMSFVVHLPKGETQQDAGQAALRGVTVACVGAHEHERAAMADLCRSWSMVVQEFTSAQGFMEHIAHAPSPQAVVVEQDMPGITGVMLVRLLRAMPGQDMPIVVVGQDPAVLHREVTSLKHCVPVGKPLQASRLLTALHGFLKVSATSLDEAVPTVRIGRLLLVEDTLINQRIMRELLKGVADEVVLANHGEEALAAVQARRFDGVLMDCQMPIMDGYEATRRIRAHEHAHGHPRTPIIALTAAALEGSREACLAAGMDDYLSKPIRENDLLRVLSRYFPQVTPSASESSAVRPAATDSARHRAAGIRTALQELQQSLGDEGYAAVVGTVASELPNMLGQVQAAVQAGDRVQLAKMAHSMKGAAAVLGIAELEQTCRRLEKEASSLSAGDQASLLQNLDTTVAAVLRALPS